MKYGWRFYLLILCVLLLVSSAEFFYRRGKKPAPAPEDYFTRLSIERPGKVIRALDFALEGLAGKRVSLKDLRGSVVFLNFWATWCVPCREEMPTIEKLQREFKNQGLDVVAIDIKEDKKAVGEFIKELGLTFTILLDKDGAVSDRYGAWDIPLSYFINRRGEFVGKVEGSRAWDSQEGRAFFLQLLREKN